MAGDSTTRRDCRTSIRSACCTLAAIVGLCIAAAPACAAEEEARVLILNGADPYLPAYLVVDSAMRTNLAGEGAKRIVYFSEPRDAQRFSMQAVEPEFLALLTKKYRALRMDVVVDEPEPAHCLTANDNAARHANLLRAAPALCGWRVC